MDTVIILSGVGTRDHQGAGINSVSCFWFTEHSKQSECELNLALRKIKRIFKVSRGQEVEDRWGVSGGEDFRGGRRKSMGNHIGFCVCVATMWIFLLFPQYIWLDIYLLLTYFRIRPINALLQGCYELSRKAVVRRFLMDRTVKTVKGNTFLIWALNRS